MQNETYSKLEQAFDNVSYRRLVTLVELTEFQNTYNQ